MVAVTAYTDQSIYKKATDAGIKRVLHKPVSYDALKTVIKDLFKGKYKDRRERLDEGEIVQEYDYN